MPSITIKKGWVIIMDLKEQALSLHKEWNGKITTTPKCQVKSREDLALAYTPGVAEPCKVIAGDKEAAYTYTIKSNTVAVVSDGSAVLGLGNIGPEAAMPVMEGKAVLFKEFGGVNAFPICLDTQDTDEIVQTVINIAPAFGGINLEDISAPRCFEIEERLKNALNIPVFHDDQHGTAVVVSAALINACKVTGRNLTDIRVLVSGDGAAGTAITRMLYSLGIRDILVCGIDGILSTELTLNEAQKALLEITNSNNISGSMAEGLCGRDVFIGVSAPGILTEDMIKTMADKPIVFAMANPEPEIMPQLAKNAGAAVVGTGRSDFGNQINNVMAFPGIFRGALDAKAERITEEMKVAAAYALADFVGESRLSANRILPDAFEDGIAAAVAGAVADAWRNR